MVSVLIMRWVRGLGLGSTFTHRAVFNLALRDLEMIHRNAGAGVVRREL